MTCKIFRLILLYFLTPVSMLSQTYSPENNIQFYINNQEVLLPSKKVNFAKKITSFQIEENQEYRYKIAKKRIYRYLKSGNKESAKEYIEIAGKDQVIFKFKRNSIKDVNGVDLYVFSDSIKNPLNLFVSKDSKNWIKVGTVTESKRYINLSGKTPYREKYSYLKLVSVDSNSSKLKIKQVASLKSNGDELGIRAKIIDGTVYTNSQKVNLQIKDYKQFDGDLISVKINGKQVTKTKLLTKWNRFIELPLKKGENKYVIEYELGNQSYNNLLKNILFQIK